MEKRKKDKKTPRSLFKEFSKIEMDEGPLLEGTTLTLQKSASQ